MSAIPGLPPDLPFVWISTRVIENATHLPRIELVSRTDSVFQYGTVCVDASAVMSAADVEDGKPSTSAVRSRHDVVLRSHHAATRFAP